MRIIKTLLLLFLLLCIFVIYYKDFDLHVGTTPQKQHTQEIQVPRIEKKEVLYKKGIVVFTQENMNNLIEFTEFLARASLTEKDKKSLKKWAITDFKASPISRLRFYRALQSKLANEIRKPNIKEEYRTRLFISFVTSFKGKSSDRPKNHIIKIIDHYNPPIKEALQLRALEFNLGMQQYQRNQKQFNRAMNSYQAAGDQINESLKRQAERAAITLPGGVILEERKNSYRVEDATGEQYDVLR